MNSKTISSKQDDEGVPYAFSLQAHLMAVLFVLLATCAVFLAGGQEAVRSRDQSTRPAAGNGQLTQYFLLRENARAVVTAEHRDDPRSYGSDPSALGVVVFEPSNAGHRRDIRLPADFETWRADHLQHGFLARGPPHPSV